MTPSDDSYSPLPGEFDQETQRGAMVAYMLTVLGETVAAIEDEHLDRILHIYHEEWSRRHNGIWVVEDVE